jgi:hypothetical protein
VHGRGRTSVAPRTAPLGDVAAVPLLGIAFVYTCRAPQPEIARQPRPRRQRRAKDTQGSCCVQSQHAIKSSHDSLWPSFLFGGRHNTCSTLNSSRIAFAPRRGGITVPGDRHAQPFSPREHGPDRDTLSSRLADCLGRRLLPTLFCVWQLPQPRTPLPVASAHHSIAPAAGLRGRHVRAIPGYPTRTGHSDTSTL